MEIYWYYQSLLFYCKTFLIHFRRIKKGVPADFIPLVNAHLFQEPEDVSMVLWPT